MEAGPRPRIHWSPDPPVFDVERSSTPSRPADVSGQDEGLTFPQGGAPTHTVVGTQAWRATAPSFCLLGHGVPMDKVPDPEVVYQLSTLSMIGTPPPPHARFPGPLPGGIPESRSCMGPPFVANGSRLAYVPAVVQLSPVGTPPETRGGTSSG